MSEGPASDEVAVIIPARNEADRIQATVTAAVGIPVVALVVVVDDGSKDGTAAVARQAGAVVTRHARNRGKGAAMETGLTIDLLRKGLRVTEVEVKLAHRATGTGMRAQLHRAHQLTDVAMALAARV